MQNTNGIKKIIRHTFHRLLHRRGVLLWGVAAMSLALPWVWPEFAQNDGASGVSDECIVMSIYDGDTMNVSCNGQRERVRLYCIDAPEMDQSPWGQRSRDYLRQITPQRVSIVSHNRDQYGRLVGEVMVGQTSLNLVMIEAGQAVMYPQYCSEVRFHRADDEAGLHELGVWAEPGLQQRPWEWRSL